jgi:hypothetical protein
MPAMPAPARNSVRRLNEKRLVGAGIGDPPKLAFFVSGLRTGMARRPVRRQAYSMERVLPVGWQAFRLLP